MAAKVGATQKLPHNDDKFEPLCRWRRGVECDTLVVYIPEFQKEQIKVQINSFGILKISGERHVHTHQRSYFNKEVKIPKYCSSNDIHAKFFNGLLQIKLPKKIRVPQEEQSQPIISQQAPLYQTPLDQIPKPETKLEDQVNKKHALHENGRGKEKVMPSQNATSSGNSHANHELKSKPPVAKMVVENMAVVAVATAWVLGGYVIYRYSCPQD